MHLNIKRASSSYLLPFFFFSFLPFAMQLAFQGIWRRQLKVGRHHYRKLPHPQIHMTADVHACKSWSSPHYHEEIPPPLTGSTKHLGHPRWWLGTQEDVDLCADLGNQLAPRKSPGRSHDVASTRTRRSKSKWWFSGESAAAAALAFKLKLGGETFVLSWIARVYIYIASLFVLKWIKNMKPWKQASASLLKVHLSLKKRDNLKAT